MHITEYVNNDIKWKPPLLTCDHKLHDDIKEPLPNGVAPFMCFIGAAGSGKTSSAIGWLTNPDIYHKKFHNIFIVMPENSRASIAGDIFKKHPPEKLFNELSLTCLEFVKAYCETESPEGHYSLLFMDDVAASLKDKHLQKLLQELIFNRRHLKLHIWAMAQSYNSLPLSIRKNISHVVLFKPRNKRELETIFSELVYLPKEDQLKVAKHVWSEPHTFMFINTGESKIYKNFNYLQIDN